MLIDSQLKTQIDELIQNFEEELGAHYDSMIISNKWMQEELPEEYFILNFSSHSLKILERKHSSRIEYEFSLDTYTVKIDQVEKTPEFINTILLKTDQVIPVPK